MALLAFLDFRENFLFVVVGSAVVVVVAIHSSIHSPFIRVLLLKVCGRVETFAVYYRNKLQLKRESHKAPNNNTNSSIKQYKKPASKAILGLIDSSLES